MFDFILKSAEKAETTLVLENYVFQVRDYRAGKTRFWRPSLYTEGLETRYGRIHNQHHSANTLAPSFGSLGKINSLYFRVLPTWVIKFVNGFCMGVRIVP